MNELDVSDMMLDEISKRQAKCRQHRDNCLNYYSGKCIALWNTSFSRKNEKGKKVVRMCPFYKVDKTYKYVVYDVLLDEVVYFCKTLEESKSIVRVYSGNYMSDGLYDLRFKITLWNGDLSEIKRRILKCELNY